jgi:hypothetical protein
MRDATGADVESPQEARRGRIKKRPRARSLEVIAFSLDFPEPLNR